jgi:AhpD family alkylhydroperoxidase
MGHHHDVIAELREPTRQLRRAIPGSWQAFGALHEEAMADGALPGWSKELIALGMAVVKQCDGCIAYHARGAAKKGATRAQVAEMLAVALLMDGGSASVYGPRAWAAFEEFSDADSVGTAPGDADGA